MVELTRCGWPPFTKEAGTRELRTAPGGAGKRQAAARPLGGSHQPRRGKFSAKARQGDRSRETPPERAARRRGRPEERRAAPDGKRAPVVPGTAAGCGIQQARPVVRVRREVRRVDVGIGHWRRNQKPGESSAGLRWLSALATARPASLCITRCERSRPSIAYPYGPPDGKHVLSWHLSPVSFSPCSGPL